MGKVRKLMNSKIKELEDLSSSDLHQYIFSIDGTVTYRRCYITKIQYQKLRRIGTYIFYRSYDEGNPYSVHIDDIDNDVATMSCHKVVVLTEPDFEKAKKIIEKGMRKSIERHQKIIDSLCSQIERLDILEVGKKAEGVWDF